MSEDGFRGALTRIAPPWLKKPWGQAFLYAMGVTLDGVVAWVEEGVQARFPALAPDDALPYLASDRGIVLGPDEPTAARAARIKRAIDDVKRSGTFRALIEQLAGYLTTHSVRLGIVTDRGTWHVLDEHGVYTVSKLAGNWSWDGNAIWPRFWVIVWPLDSYIVSTRKWGDGSKWGDVGTIGTNATRAQVSSVREIVRRFYPQGTRCMNVIIALDPSSFDYTAPPGAPLPDGKWGSWSWPDGGNVRRPSRSASARYWDGTQNTSIGS